MCRIWHKPEPYQRFLDAVLADPDDDTVRLIFADWLEEHGEPERGEFIRVQCDILRWRPHGYHPPGPRCSECDRRSTVRRREWELLDAHGCRWMADDLPGFTLVRRLSALPSQKMPGGVFLRGFAHAVAIPCYPWRVWLSPHSPFNQPIQELTIIASPYNIRGRSAAAIIKLREAIGSYARGRLKKITLPGDWRNMTDNLHACNPSIQFRFYTGGQIELELP